MTSLVWNGLETTDLHSKGVCVLVCALRLYPAIPGWGLWCVGLVLRGTCPCAVVRCVLCAPPGFAAPGGRGCLAPVCVPWLWPAACLSGVPGGPALVRRTSSGPFALRAPVGFSDAVVPFPTPEFAPPALLGGCAGHAEAGRGPGSLCLPLAPAEAEALGSLRVVPVRGPSMGLSLAGPSRVGLGLRALQWLACVDPVTDASGFDGDSAGAPGLFRVDADTAPLRSEDATPGSRACVRVRVPLGRVGRAGLPGALWCLKPNITVSVYRQSSNLAGAVSTSVQMCLHMCVRAFVTVASHCIAGQDRYPPVTITPWPKAIGFTQTTAFRALHLPCLCSAVPCL